MNIFNINGQIYDKYTAPCYIQNKHFNKENLTENYETLLLNLKQQIYKEENQKLRQQIICLENKCKYKDKIINYFKISFNVTDVHLNDINKIEGGFLVDQSNNSENLIFHVQNLVKKYFSGKI